jgi:hypothetical protein
MPKASLSFLLGTVYGIIADYSRTPACGAGEPDTNQFFTQLMRLSGNPFQPVVVRKSSIRFPTDTDAGTYLFGFAALNPRGQPRMAEDQKTVRPSPKLGTHLK